MYALIFIPHFKLIHFSRNICQDSCIFNSFAYFNLWQRRASTFLSVFPSSYGGRHLGEKSKNTHKENDFWLSQFPGIWQSSVVPSLNWSQNHFINVVYLKAFVYLSNIYICVWIKYWFEGTFLNDINFIGNHFFEALTNRPTANWLLHISGVEMPPPPPTRQVTLIQRF